MPGERDRARGEGGGKRKGEYDSGRRFRTLEIALIT